MLVPEATNMSFSVPRTCGVGCKMKEIMSSFPWWDLLPDQGVFATGISSERTLNMGMRSQSGDRVVIYLSSQCTVFVHLDKIAAAQAKANWINPTTGERLEA